jgi:hypothetical protein
MSVALEVDMVRLRGNQSTVLAMWMELVVGIHTL